MKIKRDHSPYKWFVLGVSTLVFIGFYGTELSLGIFLKPLLREFGWTRTMVSGAMSIVMGLSGPMSILTGLIADRYGARSIIALGGLFAVSGCAVMSSADALWQIYLFFGVFFAISISTCWAPLIGTVSRWFTGNRVLAIGILTSGSTIGSMLIPPIIAPFIESYGWRAAFLILALFILLTTAPALLFLGRKPDGKPHASRHEALLKGDVRIEPERSSEKGEWSAIKALKTLPYGMLLVIGFVTAAGFFFMAVHMVPYATDMGIQATAAAFVLSFISIGNIAGKILAWSIAKPMGSRLTLFLLLGLQAVALFSLIKANSLWMLLVLGALFGFGLGGSTTLRMSIIPEYFGTRTVGALVGVAGNAWGLGGFAGPILAGYIFDMTHSYNLAFITGGSLLVVGMIACILIKPPRHVPHIQNK